MNETVIKALIAQAGNQMDNVPAHDPAYAELAKLLVKQDNKVLKAFNRKIIELIIRECTNVIINDSRLNDVRSAANGCVRAINEHFGVE